ncbi:dihydrolipoamide acetyltransferase family protein [Oceanobacillus halophilus]|uniref:Dihydrolipoamide acetyltransferase component of pyruvate dehydrogenase complex n=1 Tax=Oceanobacillus halophilus TaxID=930130 RepID=A0A495A098_9BACI|nr:dihydrolipoamide acetyltransferase family protein [Oceanobacillus halophilus]RKQ32695.1 2-oxo acid dehydrogenase subunit E2 [Oceanobacillus halophilus]
MVLEVTLPRQSDKNDESLITFWHVSEGDAVEQGDPLVEVQTEKAISEIEAPQSGVVKEIKKKRADTVAVGEILAIMETEVMEEEQVLVDDLVLERAATVQPAVTEGVEKKASPRVKKLAKELGVDWQLVTPSGTNGKVTEDDVRTFAEYSRKEETTPSKGEETHPKRSIIATPSVRKFARENNVNLEDVLPSNSNGKVSKNDIEAFLAERDAASTQLTLEPEAEKKEAKVKDGQKRVPLTGMRKAIARGMVHSKSTIPHVTHFDEANVANLVDQRERVKGYFEEDGVKLTYLAYVVKALTVVLQKFPFLNASFDEEQEEIVVKENYNIGFAADTEEGLLVPVIKQADKKSLFQIAKEIQELAVKARDRTISVDEMSDATCTISNVGSANGSYFTPIINAPQSCILGIGRIEKKAIVVNETIEIQPMMALSLSYDHRLIDGVLAQEAVNELKKYLSEPGLMLAKV